MTESDVDQFLGERRATPFVAVSRVQQDVSSASDWD
jgi:hypothetical protein